MALAGDNPELKAGMARLYDTFRDAPILGSLIDPARSLKGDLLTGVEKRPEHAGREVIWQIAARRSTYKQLSKRSALYKAKRKIEKAKAQVRSKVEHPFRVIKRQFGHTKVRFRGLAKNTAQLVTLFALSNLWMARRHLLTAAGEMRL